MTDLWHTTCVACRDITPRQRRGKRHLPKGIWRDLAEEITLRLEQTPVREALRIEFSGAVLAQRAFYGLRNYWPADQVRMRKADNVLFVFRGPDYGKGDTL